MPEKSQPVGVVGLGLLGTALAERLLGAGFETVVYNRTVSKAEPLIQRGARWSDNPFTECERIVVCLFNSDVVADVLDTLGHVITEGQIVIDTTTGTPARSIAFADRLATAGAFYLESPIAASSEQTRQGLAMAMVAGDEQAYAACRDLFDAIAPKRYYLGGAGNASRMKLVNNLVLGLNRVAMAEGIALAESMQLPISNVMEVLQNGNAYSAAMDTKADKMIQRDYSTQAKLSQHLKDVKLILAAAAEANLTLPFSELHRNTLTQLEAQGLGDHDNSAIIEAFRTQK